jgi:hypothetical protein
MTRVTRRLHTALRNGQMYLAEALIYRLDRESLTSSIINQRCGRTFEVSLSLYDDWNALQVGVLLMSLFLKYRSPAAAWGWRGREGARRNSRMLLSAIRQLMFSTDDPRPRVTWPLARFFVYGYRRLADDVKQTSTCS